MEVGCDYNPYISEQQIHMEPYRSNEMELRQGELKLFFGRGGEHFSFSVSNCTLEQNSLLTEVEKSCLLGHFKVR